MCTSSNLFGRTGKGLHPSHQLIFPNILLFFPSRYTPAQDTSLPELPLDANILSFHFLARPVTVKNMSKKKLKPSSVHANRGCDFLGGGIAIAVEI